MKIAIIAPSEIPSPHANTIQIMKMAQSFCILDHQVQLIAPISIRRDIEHTEDWQYLKSFYGLKLTFPIKRLQASPRWRRYDFSIRAIRWARHLDADLVYTRLPQAATISSYFDLPTIVELHDMPQGKLGPLLFRLLLTGNGTRGMVVISQALVDDLVRAFGVPFRKTKSIIAPDGVDLERYTELPSTEQARLELSRLVQSSNKPLFEIPSKRFIAGYTGNLYPGRGTNLMLSLAKRLKDITFLIVGGRDEDVQQMQAKANSNELNNVIFTGFVPNITLPLYQAACDILLMPYQQSVSASSGGDIARYLSPMKLFEYMASSRAILSSDLPVLREVLNPGNATLLPTTDVDAWEAAIRELKSDPVHRQHLARQARRDVEKFTWNKRAQRILEALEI